MARMAGLGNMAFANSHIVNTYAKFRPAPPASLIKAVVERVTEGQQKAGVSGGGAALVCVDMGCGSGQNTTLLAPYFTTVVGVDVSQPQLDVATRMHSNVGNVSFRIGSAEAMPFETGSVNLVTCCASVHWFNSPTFYREVDRVLCPGGVLACYSYLGCTPICEGRRLRDTLLQVWHELGTYWPKGHNLLLEEYATLPQLYPDDTHIGQVLAASVRSSFIPSPHPGDPWTCFLFIAADGMKTLKNIVANIDYLVLATFLHFFTLVPFLAISLHFSLHCIFSGYIHTVFSLHCTFASLRLF
ncbi:putative methyltransferase DDB_G0268948 isoform X1 [Portunus trituberculatus]|uniref:putative methyltransferase DDB_G0268948 isoform X1 n=1 Tax=Portunus trituberculatus TaxID=210409 RepID=UPI001E1CE438|nr:putative methyltransferase DDB_G0268948 isoform X1 [Portunus trituberculatus]XP_045105605.1 putative methyltransferase DDB_G0268948 isoform X1 [Portunus trituberculatus]XP_045105606.1 putative methyltransferase DDB_G0268948 isoform X1 [Portunus trituberculatus]